MRRNTGNVWRRAFNHNKNNRPYSRTTVRSVLFLKMAVITLTYVAVVCYNKKVVHSVKVDGVFNERFCIMNMKYRKNYSNRIIFIFLLVSLTSSALISFVNIVHMKIRLVEYSRDSVKTMVQIAATSLDGDLLDSIGPEDMNTQKYWDVFNVLNGFRTSKNVKYIYTMRKVGDDLQFIVDVDDYDLAAIGESFPTYEEIEQAFLGEVTLDKSVSHDVWGNYYSAFAPVHNRAGEVVAIVGIDCSLESVEQQVHSMAVSMAVIQLICASVLGILTVIVAKLMTAYTYDASHDYLTGIYNRHYASKFIERESEEDEGFSFLLMDVDYFKAVNDTFGHQMGDRVLQALAKILSENCRSRDIAIRLGGDEFAIYLGKMLEQEQLENLYRRVHKDFIRKVKSICPEVKKIGLSCGCVVGSGKVTFDMICQQADLLLYQVKDAGKDDFKMGFLK